jgi:hypothetical protein
MSKHKLYEVMYNQGMSENIINNGRPTNRKRIYLVIASITVVAVVILLLIVNLAKPERSVTALCKVYAEENAKLSSAKGTTYSVAVFPNHKSSNPADFAKAFSNLEQAAPDEIQPDVKTLKQIFQKIDADPSRAMSASLSGLSAEASVKQWTSKFCAK